MADAKKTVKVNFLGDSKEMQKAAREGERAVESMVEGIQGFTGRAAKALAAVSFVAVGALAADSFMKGWENLNLKSKLDAQLGPGTEAADAAGMAAGKLYADGWGAGLEQINDAVRSVSTGVADLYGLSQEELQETSKWVLNMADAFGMNGDKLAEGLGKALASDLFENARQGMDWITKGIQGLPIERADEMAETLNEYSTQFREVGIGGPQAIGLMRQAVLAGARDIDTAADAIKEFAIRSQDGSKASADGFELLGLNAKEMTQIFNEGGEKADAAMKTVIDRIKAMPDGVDKTTAKVALFGTKAEDLADALYAFDPTTALRGMGEVDGAAAKVSESMASPIQKLEAFRRQLVDWATTALANLMPALDKLGAFLNTTVIPALAAFGQWFMDNKGEIAFWAGLIASLVGPIWLVMQAFAAWNAILRAVAITQAILNAVMALNPAILIVTAILALVGVFVYLWNTSEGFRQFWIDLWDAIVEAAGDAWEWIKTTAEDFWNWITEKFGDLGQWFTDTWNDVSQGAQDAWQSVEDFVAEIVEGTKQRWNAFVDAMKAVWDAVWGVVKPVVDAIGSVIGFVVDVIVGYFKVMYKIYETIFYLMKFVVEQVFSWIYENVIKPFVDTAVSRWNDMVKFFGDAWQWVKDRIAEFVAWLEETFGPYIEREKARWDAMVKALGDAWEWVKGKIDEFVAWLEATFGPYIEREKARWDAMVKALGDAWQWVKDKVNEFVTWVSETFGAYIEREKQRWNSMTQALGDAWQSVKNAVGAVVDWISEKWEWFKVRAERASEIMSEKLGGIWDGVKSGAKSAINWMVSMLNRGIRALNSLVDGLNKVPGVSIPHIPEIPGLYKGGRATAGQTYWVGEQGPELFRPTGSGTVIPNGKSMNMAGGGETVVQVFIGDTELRGIVRSEVGEVGRAGARRSTSTGGVW